MQTPASLTFDPPSDTLHQNPTTNDDRPLQPTNPPPSPANITHGATNPQHRQTSSRVTAITNANSGSPAARPGRRPKFTPSDDLVLVREVAAAKAHVAPNGETKERFEIAASRANATGKLSTAVTWKSIQDRYKRLQCRFDKQNAQEAAMSGIGGEVSEMEELLSSMKEARDDKEKEASEKRKVIKDKEAEKERLGAFMRDQASKRRGERTAREQSSSKDGDENTPHKRKRNLGDALKDGFDSEMRHFTETLARGDEERNRLEEQRLQLDRDRFETEKKEREKDRQDRKKEREAANQLELQKFRAMLELLGKGAAGPASPSA